MNEQGGRFLNECMIAWNSLLKAQVEKDEGPEAETLLRLLIVAEGPN